VTARRIDPSDVDPSHFWARVDVAGDCWTWTGSRFPDGYGQVHHDGSSHGAHRIAWALANQACLLPGYVVRHDCDNPPCCNPDHLRPGTVADNAADMVSRGRSTRGRSRSIPTGADSPAWREQCRRGHDAALRYRTKDGVRRCRECDRISARAGYHRRAAAC
jgi:hypothetical protein